MKKQFMAVIGLLLVLSIAMAGCSSSSGSSNADSSTGDNRVSSSQANNVSPVKRTRICQVRMPQN